MSWYECSRSEDHDKFDALIETSIAGGGDLIGAHCLRVVSYITREDIPAATRALDAAKKSPRQTPAATHPSLDRVGLPTTRTRTEARRDDRRA